MNTLPINTMNFQMPMAVGGPGPATRGSAIPNVNGNNILHISNLDTDLDEQRLFSFFSQYGHVISVRIMRDMYSGESRGFAFINYQSPADARRAKTVLNHTKIQNNEIRISFKRSPASNSADANLFISNLDPKVTSKELEEACSDFGEVVSCAVRLDEHQNSLGYGYVQFETSEKAKECMEKLDGKKIYEKEVKVVKFVPRSKRPTNSQRNNLYLKNFPKDFDEPKIREFIQSSFGEYGDIGCIGIFRDKKLGLYYAFVAFKNGEEAKEAVSALNGHDFSGLADGNLYVDFAQQKAQRRKMLKQKHMKYKNETNLYVRSIRPDVTPEEFLNAFKKYGQINSSCLKGHKFPGKGNQGSEKELQFGFVNFPKIDEAKEAFTQAKADEEVLNLIDPAHREKSEFIFYAQPKPVRNQYLRMIKKNIKATQLMQNQLFMMNPMFRTFMQNMNRKGMRQQGNKGGRYNNKRGRNNMMQNDMMQMPYQMQAGMPMMMMNPQNMQVTYFTNIPFTFYFRAKKLKN